MFTKISSKLRRSISNDANSGQDKSFAYGRMKKPDSYSLVSHSNTQSEKYSSAPWLKTEGEDPDEDPRSSFAEFTVPFESPDAQLKKDHAHEGYSSDGEGNLSFDGRSKNKFVPSTVQDEDINIGPATLPEFEEAEESFLQEFEGYFENLAVDNIRKEQYPNLDLQRMVYLDYANCGLFSNFQVQEHMRVLREEAPCLAAATLSKTDNGLQQSTHIIEAHDRILQLLNTSRSIYTVIFTSGLTAGFRLLGEMYPFQRNTSLLLCQDNHEAVRCIIAPAVQKGVRLSLVPIMELDLCLHGSELRKLLIRHTRHSAGGGLFVLPLQSNASGVLHSLNWVAEAQQNSWHVLVDASTFLPTESLNLSLHQPDFVVGSLSHILGYPSNFGFLLVRQQTFAVKAALHEGSGVKLVPSATSGGGLDCHVIAEDKFVDFPSFAAVSFGLLHLQDVGLEAIHKRVKSLAAWLLGTLLALRHKGDSSLPLLQVYGTHNSTSRGNIISFNVLDSTGTLFPSRLVKRLAAKNNIILSAGYLGNPGVASMLDKSQDRVRDLTIFDRPAHFMSVRLSLGPMTTFRDVFRFAQFLSRFRDEEYLSREAMDFIEEHN